MADLSGVRAALAAQAALAAGIREATSTKLSAAPMLPAVKVERIVSIAINPARGGRGGGFEARIARIAGKLLVASAKDIGRSQVDVETYLERLFEQARIGIRLGMATIVEDSWLDVARPGQVTFGEVDYAGAELEWVVKIHESPITRSS